MKQIKNQKDKLTKLGFSDIRIRFFVLISMILFLIVTPFLGLLGSTVFVLAFATFAAFKFVERDGSEALSCADYEEMVKEYHRTKSKSHRKRQTTHPQPTIAWRQSLETM
jgi:hypothetical protein